MDTENIAALRAAFEFCNRGKILGRFRTGAYKGAWAQSDWESWLNCAEHGPQAAEIARLKYDLGAPVRSVDLSGLARYGAGQSDSEVKQRPNGEFWLIDDVKEALSAQSNFSEFDGIKNGDDQIGDMQAESHQRKFDDFVAPSTSVKAWPPVTDTGLPELREKLKWSSLSGDPITLSHLSAGALFFAMSTGLPEPVDLQRPEADPSAPHHSTMCIGGDKFPCNCGAMQRVAPAKDVCAEMRALCPNCGGTGDVHSIDGEWRGACNCAASAWSRTKTNPAATHLPFAIIADEMAALRRFDECVRDGQGYDVAKDMMKRLAEIGVVRRVTAGIYEHTNFGLSVLNGDFDAPTPAAQPGSERDAALLVKARAALFEYVNNSHEHDVGGGDLVIACCESREMAVDALAVIDAAMAAQAQGEKGGAV